MQTKHYRKKAVAICEAMADVSEQMAKMHSGKKWFGYSISNLWWKQQILLINKYLQTKLKRTCTH